MSAIPELSRRPKISASLQAPSHVNANIIDFLSRQTEREGRMLYHYVTFSLSRIGLKLAWSVG